MIIDRISVNGGEEYPIVGIDGDKIYQGEDLTVRFAREIAASPYNDDPWKWIQARIKAKNFDGLHVADYIPVRTTNSVNLQAQIAGINTYYQYGDTAVGPHIDFISRELWPDLHTYNPVDFNNGTAAQAHPWLASDLYLWLNSKAGPVPNAKTANPATTDADYSTGGVYYYLPSNLKAVIIEKHQLIETRYNAGELLTESPGWAWQDVGKLWLPTETEVYGTNVWGGAGYAAGGSVQYPIFANSMNRLKLRSGSRGTWWLSTPHSGASTGWCGVYVSGVASSYLATNTWVGAPVCFRVG